jgi:hypothetical protein
MTDWIRIQKDPREPKRSRSYCEANTNIIVVGVSSLLELSARSVLNRSEGAFPDVGQLSLPSELIEYLTQRPRQCDQCGRNYFDHYYQLVTFKKYEGFAQKLPAMSKLCSENCVHEIKMRSYAEIGPNRGTLK